MQSIATPPTREVGGVRAALREQKRALRPGRAALSPCRPVTSLPSIVDPLYFRCLLFSAA